MEKQVEKSDKVEDEIAYYQELVDSFSNMQTKKKKSETHKEAYAFWDSQPVPSFKGDNNKDYTGPIEVKTLQDVKPEPYSLPKNFSWNDLDINDKTDLRKVNYLYNKI